MLNEKIAILLLAYGAKDSSKCKKHKPLIITFQLFFSDFKDPEYRRDHLKELLKKAETERRSVADMIQASGGGSKVGQINFIVKLTKNLLN